MRVRYVSKPAAVVRSRQRGFMTQEALAERAGVSLDVVYRMERGAEAVSVASVNKIATALGVEPGDIAEPVEPAVAAQAG